MKSNVPSLPAALVDRILCTAVRLHDPNDVQDMLPYSRVMLLDDAPLVHKTIQRHIMSISMDEASATARLNVLDVWRRSSMPLVYTVRAIRDASASYKTLDWWRRSGLALPECQVSDMVQVHFNGTCDGDTDDADLYTLAPGTAPPADAQVQGMLKGIRSGEVTDVSLFEERLSETGAAVLAEALASPTSKVEQIDLTCSDITFSVLRALRLPETIKKISAQYNWPAEGAEDPHAASPFPSNLQILDFEGSILGSPQQMEGLLRRLPSSLVELRLPRIRMDGEYAAILARHLPAGLRELTLYMCHLDSAAIAVIAPHLPKGLTYLAIGTNNISGDGAVALASHLPPGLEQLDVAHNPIGEKGLVALGKALLKSLTTLWVSNTGMTDAGITAIMVNAPPQLDMISMRGASLTQAGLDAILKYRPESLNYIGLEELTNAETGGELDVTDFLARAPEGLSVDLQ
ncbi:hypothetical protein H9P43_008798 [Blastocladiella emersonii ATCC 22665]|nr:hypothetical protein H9P43_008798 [Blastocladiella emersonii ATCC 22665]